MENSEYKCSTDSLEIDPTNDIAKESEDIESRNDSEEKTVISSEAFEDFIPSIQTGHEIPELCESAVSVQTTELNLNDEKSRSHTTDYSEDKSNDLSNNQASSCVEDIDKLKDTYFVDKETPQEDDQNHESGMPVETDQNEDGQLVHDQDSHLSTDNELKNEEIVTEFISEENELVTESVDNETDAQNESRDISVTKTENNAESENEVIQREAYINTTVVTTDENVDDIEPKEMTEVVLSEQAEQSVKIDLEKAEIGIKKYKKAVSECNKLLENENKSTKPKNKISDFLKAYLGYDFKEDSLFLLKNSIPIFLNSFFQLAATLISLVFCGHLGANQLAAVYLSFVFITIGVTTVLTGLAKACDTLLSQAFNGTDKKTFGKFFQKGCVISLFATIPCSAYLLNCPNLISLIIKDDRVTNLASTFIHAFMPSVFPFSLVIVIQKYLQNQLVFYPVLYINIATNLLNILLQAILVFGFSTGVAGSGVSITLSTLFQLAALIYYIYRTKLYVSTWPGLSWECLHDWQAYLKLGLTGMRSAAFEEVNFQLSGILAGFLGAIEVSAMSINSSIELTCWLVFLSISTSGNIRIGSYLGQNQPDKAVNATKVVFCYSLIVSLCLSLIMFVFGSHISFIFTTESDVVDLSDGAFKLLALVVIVNGAQSIGAAVMRSVGSQKWSVLISLVGFLIFTLPISWHLMLGTDWSIKGFWFGLLIGCFIILAAQIAFVYKIDWKQEAAKASNLSKSEPDFLSDNSDNQSKTSEELAAINESSFALTQDVGNIESGGVASKTPDTNTRRKLIKKGLVLAALIFVFLIGLLTKDLNQVPDD